MKYKVDEATKKRIELSFTYRPPVADQAERYGNIRASARSFAFMLVEACPPSRELSLALTHLEDAVYSANASIARNEHNPIVDDDPLDVPDVMGAGRRTDPGRVAQMSEVERLRQTVKDLIDALVWASGASDFAVGGQARSGWEKVTPIMDAARKLVP